MKPALFLLYQFCLYDALTGTAEAMLASFAYMIHWLVQQKQCWLHLSIWYTDWYSRNNAVSYRQMKPTLFLLYQSVYHIDKWSQHCFCCTSQCVILTHWLVQQKQCWLHLSIWYTDWYSRNNAGLTSLFLLYQSVYHIDKWNQHCFCCTSRCII
jgi:hypothetical protein